MEAIPLEKPGYRGPKKKKTLGSGRKSALFRAGIKPKLSAKRVAEREAQRIKRAAVHEKRFEEQKAAH